MKPIKVLIVDDQTLIRDGLSSLLSFRTEVEVVGTAENGLSAVTGSLELKPDIILMDIRMPVMDGITALKKIKEKQTTIRVIMLTTFDDQDYIVKSLKAGAEGYLLKDTPIENLVRALQQVNSGTFQATEAIVTRLATILEAKQPTKIDTSAQDIIKECYEKLSEREKKIFEYLGHGMTNKEIAKKMDLTEGTVKNYMTNILASFDKRDRTQLALLAYKLGYG